MYKPLTELSAKELQAQLITSTKNGIQFSYNDIISELERRRARRHANITLAISITAIIISAISLLGTILALR